MPRLPGYGFPFQYYRPYNYRPRTPVYKSVPPPEEIVSPPEQPEQSERYEPPKQGKSADPVWLDLFGIKLYFDNVLILSLLFFLYKEEVKDEGLFLALVLLLIS